ncbi:AP complex subunit beta [Plasmodiophora brassicae]|uniref:AP complex subunit beta n=1 Tax=Plasmodiophora brassicae TaxID=37360 RepID=A0A3P3Y334_PLABS|nr:unnamed protein product [Plasmodiophora brassicae]
MVGGGGSDGKYFQNTTKKGEVKDLADELNSLDKTVVKEAVKKVIAAMTVGKDVSSLFPHVIKSMQTDNIELKKLIYLYIISYARSNPDKAILVVNTFQKDAGNLTPNPLVRALAIRTMGCIRVDRITEYLCEPLEHALNDSDPYVRKTAAVCTAKLFDINQQLVEDRGFIDKLREMISDNNPTVVANAVASLSEISSTAKSDVFKITSSTLHKLLTALNECTEWGQVFILDSLSKYVPTSTEAEDIIERVSPRLQHANSAVVMSAIKLVINYIPLVQSEETKAALQRKLAPPLVTLLSAEPEIQYVALRNINLIVQKYPDILSKEVRVFFCKYNDPVYVKMEKLDVMMKLVSVSNVDQVLLEFKEYAQEVDVDFVRRAVRAIGRAAIKLEPSAEKCIRVLLDLISTKVNYVVQEAVIVIKDIFRRYPNRYEGVIVNLCENLDSLDEPEAKSAMIWIIGEYAERIEDAAERLESWIDTFEDETAQVQLSLLTATVKLFLKRPEAAQELVRRVLDLSTERSDNPDLRDRGYVYWRLLSTDPAAAKKIVVALKPVISDDTGKLPDEALDVLLKNVATLASVYHKTPDSFIKGAGDVVFHLTDEKNAQSSEEEEESEEDEDEDEEEEEDEEETEEDEEEQDSSDEEHAAKDKAAKSKRGGAAAAPKPVVDLLDIGSMSVAAAPPPSAAVSVQAFASGFPPTKKYPVNVDKVPLQLQTSFTRKNRAAFMELTIENRGQAPVTQAAVQFNENFVGVLPASPVQLQGPIPPGQSGIGYVQLKDDGPCSTAKSRPGQVQAAIKTDLGVGYFVTPFLPHVLFAEDGILDKQSFPLLWQEIDDAEECQLPAGQPEQVIEKLARINVVSLARVQNATKGLCVYLALRLKNVHILVEAAFSPTQTTFTFKSKDETLRSYAVKSVQHYVAEAQ